MKPFSDYFDLQSESSTDLKLVGIKLTSFEKGEINSKLDLLKERAPVSTTLRLSLIKDGEFTKASLIISGTGKEFRAIVSGKDPLHAYEKAEKLMDKQLLEWKKNRFRQYRDTYYHPYNFITGGRVV